MSTRTRRKRPAWPIRDWTERNILAPARKIFDTAPWTYTDKCWECEGSGWCDIADGYCMYCYGTGRETIDISDKHRRKIIDKRLRAAGLDPACFDDNGRLVTPAEVS